MLVVIEAAADVVHCSRQFGGSTAATISRCSWISNIDGRPGPLVERTPNPELDGTFPISFATNSVMDYMHEYGGLMHLALVQHDIVWEDPAANFKRLEPRIEAAAATGARMILLTEMFATGFTMNSRSVAEPSDGPAATFLTTLATRLDCYIGGTFTCDQPDTLPTNRFLIATPDGGFVHYDKLHPFSYAREDEAYAAGNQVVTTTIDDVRVSLFVCYDLRFADDIWTLARDTDLYLFPANWPESRRHHWKSLLVARAIENQAYVAGCNRVGIQGDLSYVGDSMIVDPQGEVLGHAAGGETIVHAEINPSVVAATRAKFPFMRDRRPSK